MPSNDRLDGTDARLLIALAERPDATAVALAERLGLSRNTVHARLARLAEGGLLDSFERRVRPRTLGYPLMAYVTARVTQRRLGEVAVALEAIPEVLEATGISGPTDLMIRVVAADTDDLYRIAGQILAIDGIERTDTSLAMRELVSYRITPLLRRSASGGTRPREAPGERRPR